MDYIKAGVYADQDSLLDLRYDYDTGRREPSPCNRLTSAAVGLNNSTCSGSVGLGEYANEPYT